MIKNQELLELAIIFFVFVTFMWDSEVIIVRRNWILVTFWGQRVKCTLSMGSTAQRVYQAQLLTLSSLVFFLLSVSSYHTHCQLIMSQNRVGVSKFM